MAASLSQAAGAPLLRIHPAPSSGHSRHPDMAPQQLFSGDRKFVSSSGLPAYPGGLRQVDKERQELLWRQFFLCPALWSDLRKNKQSLHSPDFRHQESKEVLWVNNVCKPAWVDEQLATLDNRIRGPPTSTSNSTLPNSSYRPRGLDGYGVITAETVGELCENRQLTEAVEALGYLAQTESLVPQSLFYSFLKRCVVEKNLVLGRRVHDLIVQSGNQSNTFLANHSLRMYASEGRVDEATEVFRRVATPDAFMWSSIIWAHAKHGDPKQAVHLYHEMRSSSVKPDCHVFVAALQACASALDLKSGRQVHADVLESGIQPNLFVCNCLVDMYAKCGSLDDARRLFDSFASRDVVTWNAMITGYAKCGRLEDARRLFDSFPAKNVVTWNAMIAGYAENEDGHEAISLYERMEQEGMVVANHVTFSCLLKACARIGALQQGMQLHSKIVERGLEAKIDVGTCLVDMYAKCGRLEDARRVFDGLPRKDVVTWNAMIAGYAEQEHGQEALSLYEKMQREVMIAADHITFACLLKACAKAGALQQGKQLHSQILGRGLETDILVGNSLIDMYAKCGRLDEACRVFDSLPVKNSVTWTVMIDGFGQCNEGHKAIACFQQMLQGGCQPEDSTFTSLLVACSHEGLVDEGRQYFNAMLEDPRGVVPTVQHYTCMVDLLGRSGHLDEAEKMLLSMPFESDIVGWMSLLNACKSHGDIERGRRCFESVVKLDPQRAAAYVLMSKMYADDGRWTDVDRVQRLKKCAGACKKPAEAGIEVNRQVRTFVVGEERGDISNKLRNMNERLKGDGGHVPHTQLVLKPLSDQEKEDELCGHAEKLALAYGLLNTPDGTPLLVTKNLRMCGDCHSATQVMSRIEKREIVVRDAHRVHRFVEGSCYCGGRP